MATKTVLEKGTERSSKRKEPGAIRLSLAGMHWASGPSLRPFCAMCAQTWLTWLDLGLDNIVYLDIDAHHGDGVQDAFHDDPPRAHHLHPRGRPLAVHRRRRRPGRRLRPQLPGAARPSTTPRSAYLMQRAVLPLIARPKPAGDPAADRRRRAARRPAGQALAVQQRLLGGGRRGPRAGAAAGRGRRRRLQPVHGRALLGGDLGRAERGHDP